MVFKSTLRLAPHSPCQSVRPAARKLAAPGRRNNSTLPQQNTLSWPDYLTIRGKKRKWELVSLNSPCSVSIVLISLRRSLLFHAFSQVLLQAVPSLVRRKLTRQNLSSYVTPVYLCVLISYIKYLKGFDPLIVYGGATFACGGKGSLACLCHE